MTADEWSSGSDEANFVRTLYFDGKAVRVYRDERETVDHLLEGVTAPEEVVQKAKTGDRNGMMRSSPKTPTSSAKVLTTGASPRSKPVRRIATAGSGTARRWRYTALALRPTAVSRRAW